MYRSAQNTQSCFSTHFPVLRQLLREVHSAIASHKFVLEIDEALSAGDYHKLMEIANIRTFGALLKNDLDSKYEQCNNSECGDSVLRQPDLEEEMATASLEHFHISLLGLRVNTWLFV